MTLRAVRLRNLLLLVAVFASIVAAGCWQNKRLMQRVLDEGYPTIVEIIGAGRTRMAPVTLDGWRPRFLEQDLSVNLRWDGKDGKPHTYYKVPVSESFAATIVSGDEVRLAVVPAKALDDPLAVPVINADAAPRYSSLQEWIEDSGYVAAASWLGFFVMTAWLARSRSGPVGTAARARRSVAYPPRRTIMGCGMLILGAILTLRAWTAMDPGGQAPGGLETTADITNAVTVKLGSTETHIVQLSWRDAQGGVHHYGPIRISDDFWNKITHEGVLSIKQARIRYGGETGQEKPVILDDRPETSWQAIFGLAVGIVLLVGGAGSLYSAMRSVRAVTSSAKAQASPLRK
ncbi:MAG: hypothetical protein JOY81_14345 [Alphaproteobacteria bacterium]|nr:hypothetical protein [Alphaproteobacteria bacterium]